MALRRKQDGDAPVSGDTPRLRPVDKWMEIVGIALAPAGLIAIILGWVGVANTGYTFLQTPYVVSGGLLGVGLLMMSGFVYLASWISRTSAEQRRENRELLEALRAMQTQLAIRPPAPSEDDGTNGTSATFVATPSGVMFHRPDCTIVVDREDIRRVTGDEEGYKPCGMCDPLATEGQRPAMN